MRSIHLSDLHHAACALRAVPDKDKAASIARSISDAKTADSYRKRFGKSHPRFGHGTLTSAIGPITEPPNCDRAYLEAMQSVVSALLHHSRL